MGVSTDVYKLRRLLQLGRALVADLDTETVLQRILEEAREITGARYAALGVFDETRSELKRFVTSGIDDATHRSIGELPRGRGVLGVLIEDPRPLRLADVGEHPHSYGFPPGHPEMHTFLGVPILVHGQPWGNLYLTEKAAGESFTEEDEEAVVVLSEWAATAIENADLYETSERRRRELERAVRGLEASQDIAAAIGGLEGLEQVLELIVKRGRALVGARTVLIMLREGEELVVAASAGHANSARGRRLPLRASTSGRVLAEGRPRRIRDVSGDLEVAPLDLGVPEARTALLVPMLHRAVPLGVVAAFDHGEDGDMFTEADEELLRGFAASAANAVAIKRSVEAGRLKSAIEAADAERGRWARELHDQTLQALGALRVLLASAARRSDPAVNQRAIEQAVSDIEAEIENLRAVIADLRPALLDDLGLLPALEALLERRRDDALEITSEFELPDPERGEAGLSPELEATAYRLVQEALTNVVNHASATHAHVVVRAQAGELRVEVQDNGTGFDTAAKTSGFGLIGMRERVFLLDGRIDVRTSRSGTSVSARLPAASPAGDRPVTG